MGGMGTELLSPLVTGGWEINGKVVKSEPPPRRPPFLPCLKQGTRLLWVNSFQYAKSVILLLLTPLKITCGSH